jgi:predicted PurR-regulated permease PerM
MNPQTRDLAQITLGVLFIGGLITASFWILRPFLPAVIWATMVVVATWPVMLGIQARLWGKRSLAVMVMTLILLLLLVVPLSLAIATIADNSDRIVGWAKWLSEFKVPPPPDWVAGLPLVGARLQQFWEQVAATGIEEYASRLAPYAQTGTQWFIGKAGNFGLLFLQFLLTVAISAIMYAGGESAGSWLKRFGRRLAGKRGEDVVVLASQAIRGIAQLGPILVLLPAVVWVYWSGDNTWGTFLLVWTLVVGSLDNILRPYLIKKGADLPLLLIFAGVIGGMLSIGLVGIFVGPVVLAVAYTLLDAWIEDDRGNVQPPAPTS